MLRSVFGKSLWDQRTGILIWALAIGAVGVLYASFWPLMNNPDMAAALAAFPPGLLDALGMTDITSPAGYLGATSFGLLGPILILIFAATLGSARWPATRRAAGSTCCWRTRWSAGRSSCSGQPRWRWRSPCPVAILFGALLVAAGPANFASVGVANLAAASVQLGLLGLFFGVAGVGRSARQPAVAALAWGAVALIGVLTYIANTLGPSIEAITWSRSFSPFYYYSGGRPLVNGWQLDDWPRPAGRARGPCGAGGHRASTARHRRLTISLTDARFGASATVFEGAGPRKPPIPVLRCAPRGSRPHPHFNTEMGRGNGGSQGHGLLEAQLQREDVRLRVRGGHHPGDLCARLRLGGLMALPLIGGIAVLAIIFLPQMSPNSSLPGSQGQPIADRRRGGGDLLGARRRSSSSATSSATSMRSTRTSSSSASRHRCGSGGSPGRRSSRRVASSRSAPLAHPARSRARPSLRRR